MYLTGHNKNRHKERWVNSEVQITTFSIGENLLLNLLPVKSFDHFFGQIIKKSLKLPLKKRQ